VAIFSTTQAHLTPNDLEQCFEYNATVDALCPNRIYTSYDISVIEMRCIGVMIVILLDIFPLEGSNIIVNFYISPALKPLPSGWR